MNQWLTKYRLPLFYLLSYALSWWPAPFTGGQLLPHGPALAALIIALTSGRSGLGDWWRRLTRRPVRWYWLLVGPMLIVAYEGLAFLIALLLGGEMIRPVALPSTAVIVEILLLGGLWEEPGWSGYALPELQHRYADRRNGTRIAALLAGVGRAAWHLPLFLYGQIPWFDLLLFEVAFQLIIAWIYNRSGGSVPAVMFFHFVSNFLGAGVFAGVFAGSDHTTYYAIFVALAVLIALLLTFSPPPERGNPSRPYKTGSRMS